MLFMNSTIRDHDNKGIGHHPRRRFEVEVEYFELYILDNSSVFNKQNHAKFLSFNNCFTK